MIQGYRRMWPIAGQTRQFYNQLLTGTISNVTARTKDTELFMTCPECYNTYS